MAPNEKDAARHSVSHLRTVDYGESERTVRINPLDTFAEQDIPLIVASGPDALVVPKVESAEDIRQVAAIVEKRKPGQKPVKLIALLETPKGIAEAGRIAVAHPRVDALALGAEDYTAAPGAARTKGGQEIYTARTLLINAAAVAAGIQSIDTPFTDANDEEGLLADTRLAKALGFKGKLSINLGKLTPSSISLTPRL